MERKDLEILTPGLVVILKGGVEARILAAIIRVEGVVYECAWWNGGARCVDTLLPIEIEQAKTNHKIKGKRIGFTNAINSR